MKKLVATFLSCLVVAAVFCGMGVAQGTGPSDDQYAPGDGSVGASPPASPPPGSAPPDPSVPPEASSPPDASVPPSSPPPDASPPADASPPPDASAPPGGCPELGPSICKPEPVPGPYGDYDGPGVNVVCSTTGYYEDDVDLTGSTEGCSAQDVARQAEEDSQTTHNALEGPATFQAFTDYFFGDGAEQAPAQAGVVAVELVRGSASASSSASAIASASASAAPSAPSPAAAGSSVSALPSGVSFGASSTARSPDGAGAAGAGSGSVSASPSSASPSSSSSSPGANEGDGPASVAAAGMSGEESEERTPMPEGVLKEKMHAALYSTSEASTGSSSERPGSEAGVPDTGNDGGATDRLGPEAGSQKGGEVEAATRAASGPGGVAEFLDLWALLPVFFGCIVVVGGGLVWRLRRPRGTSGRLP